MSRKAVLMISLCSAVAFIPHLNVQASLSASTCTILLASCWYMLKFSHVEWCTFGSAPPRESHYSSSFSSSSEVELVEELLEELELSGPFSDCSTSASTGASLQSGFDGCCIWPDLVKSGCSAPMRICRNISSRVRKGAESMSLEYTSKDPFPEE